MAEKEYIEREAVIDLLTNRDVVINPHDEVANIREDVECLPAADVRPVILCKDCAHSRKGKQSLECEKHIYAWNNLNRLVNEDDSCSWGVKREES